MNQIVAVSAAFCVVLASLGAQGAQSSRRASLDSPSDVINFVGDAFWNTNSVGSLVTGGTCNAPDAESDAVSDTLPHPPAGPFHNVAEALTALSKVDPRVSWSRGPSGLVHVKDGNVPEGLLRVRIRHLHFKNRAQPGFAIYDILSAPEVRAYLRNNHIEQGIYSRLGGIFTTSTKGLPRLSSTMRNVTVAQALDRVAEFYHRLWIYSYCQKGPRKIVVITAQ